MEDRPEGQTARGEWPNVVNAQLEWLYAEVDKVAGVRDVEELGPEVEPADAVTSVELPHHSQLPAGERGLYVRYDAGCADQHWGTPATVEMALKLARRWRENGHQPTIHFGDISARNFAQTRCHSAHRTGTHLDVDLPGSLPRDRGYNEARRRSCSALCWYAISLGARRVLFSDSAVAVAVNRLAQESHLPGRVAVRADHDNHFHIEMPLA